MPHRQLERRLLIKRPRQAFQLKVIIRVEGDVNYSLIRMVDGTQVLVAVSLWAMAERLPEFVRIHRRHLINPAYVKALYIQSPTSGKLTLTNGDVLPVARRRKHEVKILLKQYANGSRSKR